MITPCSRTHASWWAFAAHRLSGLALCLFLPVHFWALGTAIDSEARFEGFLRWADAPLVKVGEWGLITLLALHLTGGVRLLAIEFLPWHDGQKTAVALSVGASFLVGMGFLLNAF
jgi:fumarate reductase subunit D